MTSGRRLRAAGSRARRVAGPGPRDRRQAAARAHARHRQRSEGAGSAERPVSRSTTRTPTCCAASSPATAACSKRITGSVTIRTGFATALLAPGADVILVSGGSSVGREDYAPRLIAEIGELAIHGVAMRPSSPAGLGRIGETLVFLLPGNPVSCLCAYDFFAGRAHSPARRALARLAAPHAAVRRRAQDRFRHRSRRLLPRPPRRRPGRADRAQRRVDPFLDDARRRLRDRAGRDAKATDPTPKSRCTSTTERASNMSTSAQRPARTARSPLPGKPSSSTSSRATRPPRSFASTCGSRRWARNSCPSRDALDRVLARDVVADIDVPGFDRSNVDGFAVQAQDTFGAMEETPRSAATRTTRCSRPASCRAQPVIAGRATPIATGGMLPRGADAVLMVEHSELVGPA